MAPLSKVISRLSILFHWLLYHYDTVLITSFEIKTYKLALFLGYKGRRLQKCLPVSVSEPPWSKAAISDQYIDPWFLEDVILLARPGSHRLHAMYSWNMYIAYYRAGALLLSQELNLAEINHNLLAQAFSWKLQAFNRLQSPQIVTSFLLVRLLFRWEGRVLELLILPSS